VKTHGEIAVDYEFHPESKCADAYGNPCGKQTIGLLRRRHVQIDYIKYIGKEIATGQLQNWGTLSRSLE